MIMNKNTIKEENMNSGDMILNLCPICKTYLVYKLEKDKPAVLCVSPICRARFLHEKTENGIIYLLPWEPKYGEFPEIPQWLTKVREDAENSPYLNGKLRK